MSVRIASCYTLELLLEYDVVQGDVEVDVCGPVSITQSDTPADSGGWRVTVLSKAGVGVRVSRAPVAGAAVVTWAAGPYGVAVGREASSV
jgi:hypothetical protein